MRLFTYIIMLFFICCTSHPENDGLKKLDEIEKRLPKSEYALLELRDSLPKEPFNSKKDSLYTIKLQKLNAKINRTIDSIRWTLLSKKSQYATKRFRFFVPYDNIDEKIYYEVFEPSPKYDTKLLHKLGFCVEKNETLDYNYGNPYLAPCDKGNISDYAIFYLDSAQKDKSALMVACYTMEAQSNYHDGYGIIYAFKQEGGRYKLQDIIFGRLAAFDVDNNKNLMPIVFGDCNSSQPPEIKEEAYFETVFAWDGEHFIAKDIVSARFKSKYYILSQDSLIYYPIFYNNLKNKYVNSSFEIIKGVKVHYHFRSLVLKMTKEERLDAWKDRAWKRGFSFPKDKYIQE